MHPKTTRTVFLNSCSVSLLTLVIVAILAILSEKLVGKTNKTRTFLKSIFVQGILLVLQVYSILYSIFEFTTRIEKQNIDCIVTIDIFPLIVYGVVVFVEIIFVLLTIAHIASNLPRKTKKKIADAIEKMAPIIRKITTKFIAFLSALKEFYNDLCTAIDKFCKKIKNG